MPAEFWRIGEKLISRGRIQRRVEQVLDLRSRGASQAEAAKEVGTDRAFVSRLESLGEVRKGGRTALIAHPVCNKTELTNLARDHGVEFVLVLNNEERWRYVEQDGAALFQDITELLARVREYDAVIVIGSDRWIRFAEKLLGDAVIGHELGPSPISSDREVDLELVRGLLRAIGA